jgi:hypothetical protein
MLYPVSFRCLNPNLVGAWMLYLFKPRRPERENREVSREGGREVHAKHCMRVDALRIWPQGMHFHE